jgi:hypothetical protein
MSFGFVNPAIGGERWGCCALVIASIVMQFLWRWLLSMRRERVQRKTLTSRRRVLIGTRRGLVRFSIERGRGDLISTQRRRMSTRKNAPDGRFKKFQIFLETIYARVGQPSLGVRVASNGPLHRGLCLARMKVRGVCSAR